MTAFQGRLFAIPAPSWNGPRSWAERYKGIIGRWGAARRLLGQAGTLRDCITRGLDEHGLDQDVQLDGNRAIRGRVRVAISEPGPRRLDPDPIPLWTMGGTPAGPPTARPSKSLLDDIRARERRVIGVYKVR